MTDLRIFLPKTIIDAHCHGRDLEHSHKTTILQTLIEALGAKINISAFMPNTGPITSINMLNIILRIIREAEKKLRCKNRQKVYFAITDHNLHECRIALQYEEVLGLKDYPLSKKDGKTVTTGTAGVSKRSIRLAGMQLCVKYNKVYARHCDNPEVIASEKRNSINAEVTDIEDTISIASKVPGVKVVICHVSCRKSAEVILNAQKKGMFIVIEICGHYLWFDADGTNWNPNLDPVFYKCFNNLRSGEDREFLNHIAFSANNPLTWVASDNAAHATLEKINQKLGGLPSNQELVPVICTLAKKYGTSNQRVAELLSLNAGRFLRIPISPKSQEYILKPKIDDIVYNKGIVTNPWNGSELLFPHELTEELC